MIISQPNTERIKVYVDNILVGVTIRSSLSDPVLRPLFVNGVLQDDGILIDGQIYNLA